MLTRNGTTVASQLRRPTPAALEISQGTDFAPPGDPGSGSLSLYEAVKLASRQPARKSPDNSRPWREYYMFGAPGSPACAAAARSEGSSAKPGLHCLLSGPDSDRQELLGGLPVGFTPSHAQVSSSVKARACCKPRVRTLTASRVSRIPRLSSMSSQTTRRSLATRSRALSRAPTRPMTPPSSSASPPAARSCCTTLPRARASRRARQPPRPDARPAFRYRARQPAGCGPGRRLPDLSARNSGRHPRRDLGRLQDPISRRPRHPAALWSAARESAHALTLPRPTTRPRPPADEEHSGSG